MSETVLVVGGGGREHAIARALADDQHGFAHARYAAPGDLSVVLRVTRRVALTPHPTKGRRAADVTLRRGSPVGDRRIEITRWRSQAARLAGGDVSYRRSPLS